jgi:hypothetical protein
MKDHYYTQTSFLRRPPSRCGVTSSNGEHSSYPGLTSSQAGGYLTLTSTRLTAVLTLMTTVLIYIYSAQSTQKTQLPTVIPAFLLSRYLAMAVTLRE